MSTAARKARKARGERFEREELTPEEIPWPEPPALVRKVGTWEVYEVARGMFADVFYLRVCLPARDGTGVVRKVMLGQLQSGYEPLKPGEVPPLDSKPLTEAAVLELVEDLRRG